MIEFLLKSTEKRQEDRATRIAEQEYAELRDADQIRRQGIQDADQIRRQGIQDADQVRRQGIQSVAQAAREDSRQAMKESCNLLERFFQAVPGSTPATPIAPIAAVQNGVPATSSRNQPCAPPATAPAAAGVNGQGKDDYDDL